MSDPLFIVPLDMLVYFSQNVGVITTYRWRCDVNNRTGSVECDTEFTFESRDRAVELAVEHLRHHHGLLPVALERGLQT